MPTISRRQFVSGVAALPLARALDFAPLFGSTSRPRVVVVGAGAFGGWAALHLRQMGADVVLVDRWGAGNARSSSGGRTRVIRAIYGPDRIYSEMVKRAFDLWMELEKRSVTPLYEESGVLWMHRGEDTYVRQAVPILHDLGFPVEQIPIERAIKRYAQINFAGVKSVWFEKRAGQLQARTACEVLRREVERAGAVYREAAIRPAAIEDGSMKPLAVEGGGSIDADAYVFACGPWLGQLFPDVIGDAVQPTRQEVFYFETPDDGAWRATNLPIWIDFGKRIVYGVPAPNGRWFKFADDTRGAAFEPTSGSRQATQEGLIAARAFLKERFPALVNARVLAAEVCQYENSPDGNLIVDRHPAAKNVWIIGGGSGHGFKLSPVVGEIVARAVLTSAPIPATLQLARLGDARRRTQFDSRHE